MRKTIIALTIAALFAAGCADIGFSARYDGPLVDAEIHKDARK